MLAVGSALQRFKYDTAPLILAKDDPEMPFRVRNILDKIGDEPIIRIQLGRTPVQGVPLKLLNLLSNAKFHDKQIELGYDELYHNYLLITIRNNQGPNVLQHLLGSDVQNLQASTVLKLEKAQRIALKRPIIPDELIDVYEIPLPGRKTLTLNRLISTALNADKNFYKYDAAENNMCQTFVENIIELNGLLPYITDEATLNALKPIDAKALISTLGSRVNLVKMATDLGATFDKLVYDRKIKWKNSHPKEYTLPSQSNKVDAECLEVLFSAVVQLEKNASNGLSALPMPSLSALQ